MKEKEMIHLLDGIRILYAEDEKDLLELISEFLSSEGAQVHEASGGDEAFKKYAEDKYDLVLTDMKMPKGDGISLIQRIREKSKKIPIICMTGYSDQTEKEIQALGANCLLTKPCRMEDLLNQITRIVTT